MLITSIPGQSECRRVRMFILFGKSSNITRDGVIYLIKSRQDVEMLLLEAGIEGLKPVAPLNVCLEGRARVEVGKVLYKGRVLATHLPATGLKSLNC